MSVLILFNSLFKFKTSFFNLSTVSFLSVLLILFITGNSFGFILFKFNKSFIFFLLFFNSLFSVLSEIGFINEISWFFCSLWLFKFIYSSFPESKFKFVTFSSSSILFSFILILFFSIEIFEILLSSFDFKSRICCLDFKGIISLDIIFYFKTLYYFL